METFHHDVGSPSHSDIVIFRKDGNGRVVTIGWVTSFGCHRLQKHPACQQLNSNQLNINIYSQYKAYGTNYVQCTEIQTHGCVKSNKLNLIK